MVEPVNAGFGRSGTLTALLALGATAISGCGGGGGGAKAGAATTRDSAGVKIVENAGPAWGSGQGWKVVDSPLVDVGSKGGEAVYELDQVRGPVRLSDGRLAIANATTSEVRLYDAAGKHVRSVGRSGSGPGEFQQIAGIWRGPGDSLWVSDLLVRRMTVLDSTAAVGRSYTLGAQGGQLLPTNGKVDFAIPTGVFADGSVVGVSQTFAINQPRQGVYRDSMSVIRYGPDGVVRDTLGRFPGAEMEQITMTFGPQSVSAPTPVPLGKQTAVAVGKSRLFVVQNNAWEVEIRGLDGALQVLARSPAKAASITPSDVSAHRKEQLEAMEALPQIRGMPEAIKKQFTARISEAKYPPTFPFFASVLTDEDGNLWAQEAVSPTVKAQRYAVVDSTGRWLGIVTMPAEFRATYIASDAVYGVWKDDEGVEHLRGYPLRKG